MGSSHSYKIDKEKKINVFDFLTLNNYTNIIATEMDFMRNTVTDIDRKILYKIRNYFINQELEYNNKKEFIIGNVNKKITENKYLILKFFVNYYKIVFKEINRLLINKIRNFEIREEFKKFTKQDFIDIKKELNELLSENVIERYIKGITKKFSNLTDLIFENVYLKDFIKLKYKTLNKNFKNEKIIILKNFIDDMIDSKEVEVFKHPLNLKLQKQKVIIEYDYNLFIYNLFKTLNNFHININEEKIKVYKKKINIYEQISQIIEYYNLYSLKKSKSILEILNNITTRRNDEFTSSKSIETIILRYIEI